jgi:hypothetical protein
MADIVWLIGVLLGTLALDFLCRRFGNGRLRRHPGGPERPGPPPESSRLARPVTQTDTTVYSATR